MRFGSGAGEEAPGGEFGSLRGIDQFGRGITVSFTPASVLGLASTALQVVVNRPFLEATAAGVGDELTIPIGGSSRRVVIAGALESFPTTNATRPAAVVDIATLNLLRFQSSRGAGFAVEWWLDVDDAALPTVFETTTSGPFAGATVLGREETRERLSADPLALAMIGALSLGAVVAALFAVIGLAVNAAVSARQRRTEFALLRALGLSPDQLSGWLWLENGSLVLVSLVAGTGLGLLIGWVVLPFVTVTQQAAVPFPPVIVEVPWLSILLLEAASAIALAITLLGLARIMRRAGLGSVLRMGED
jgi:predicted lysophospholipase L1 biosynthesis ABC-type transport system permease subunit